MRLVSSPSALDTDSPFHDVFFYGDSFLRSFCFFVNQVLCSKIRKNLKRRIGLEPIKLAHADCVRASQAS